MITLRSVAGPEVESDNLSLGHYVDVFKNLSRDDQEVLRQRLAPSMASADFRSLYNQSSLFFTDVINRRQIDTDRQAKALDLLRLWSSAKEPPEAVAGLSQLKFFREFDLLMNTFSRKN